MRLNDTDLRPEYEDYFIKKYKTKLNSLYKQNSQRVESKNLL